MNKKYSQLKEWGEMMTMSARTPGMPPENPPSIPVSLNYPRPGVDFGRSDLSDPRAIDNINNSLDRALDTYYLTPYIALERIRKVLAPFGIVVPAVVFMNSNGGSKVFAINQWGGIYGTTGKSSDPYDPVDTNLQENPNFSLYYTWAYDRTRKVYNVYARIVDSEKLSDLMSMSEESEKKPHAKGTRVVVAHKGHKKQGKVIRHVPSDMQGGDSYIVDVGEYGSHKFPAHKVMKEASIFGSSKKKPSSPGYMSRGMKDGTWEGGKEPYTPPKGDPRVDKTALRAREYYKKHGRMPPDLA